MNIIAYPVFIAQLGGAEYVRHNARSAWVKLADKEIRLPFKRVELSLDDGMRVADIARKYAACPNHHFRACGRCPFCEETLS